MSGFFQSILLWITQAVNSYGLALILFTVLIKLVLTPFDLKSRKSMRRMETINPQLQALQKKYANDKEKLQKKTSELYKKERISPLGGCLPMLLTMPILFIMFGAMRSVANVQLLESLMKIQNTVGALTDPEAIRAALPALDTLVEPFLWMKNLWVADSPFTSALPIASNALAALGNSIDGIATAEQMTAIRAFIDGDIYQTIVLPHYNAMPMPGGNFNVLMFNFTLYNAPNGYFILPILSFITQFLTTKIGAPAAQPTASGSGAPGGAIMKWMMPLFSIYICATSNAAFALYWVISNVVSLVQQLVFKWYFAYQDKKEKSIQVVLDDIA